MGVELRVRRGANCIGVGGGLAFFGVWAGGNWKTISKFQDLTIVMCACIGCGIDRADRGHSNVQSFISGRFHHEISRTRSTSRRGIPNDT